MGTKNIIGDLAIIGELTINDKKVITEDTVPSLTDAGSATQPVYIENGVPVAITHTLEASVPSGAKFTDTTYELATNQKEGLMSADDKANLDVIVNSFNSDDADTTINTIKEVLKAFENAPEGTDIANALASKADKTEIPTFTYDSTTKTLIIS